MYSEAGSLAKEGTGDRGANGGTCDSGGWRLFPEASAVLEVLPHTDESPTSGDEPVRRGMVSDKPSGTTRLSRELGSSMLGASERSGRLETDGTSRGGTDSSGG